MLTIQDLISANAVAGYLNAQAEINGTPPFLGEQLFPRRKKIGLELGWIKGYNRTPIALAPSGFDSKPTLRNRLGVTKINTQLPFFREADSLKEEDRQLLLNALEYGKDEYIQAAVKALYDGASDLLAGAETVPEIMRMSLLATGGIDIQAANDSGAFVRYTYDYDPSGEWHERNFRDIVKNGTPWTEASADPLKDLQATKEYAQASGIRLTRVVFSARSWGLLVNHASTKRHVTGSNDSAQLITETLVRQFISGTLGLQVAISDSVYKDTNKVDQFHFPEEYVALLPAGVLGNTWYGTTPEEADQMHGLVTGGSVSIVNTGVAILTKLETLPSNLITAVSEVVLPSFESMNYVFSMRVAEFEKKATVPDAIDIFDPSDFPAGV